MSKLHHGRSLNNVTTTVNHYQTEQEQNKPNLIDEFNKPSSADAQAPNQGSPQQMKIESHDRLL